MAADRNPYQLGSDQRKGGPNRPARAAPLTQAEQVKKLTGYIEVPKDLWPFVKYSTHVRYVETAAKILWLT